MTTKNMTGAALRKTNPKIMKMMKTIKMKKIKKKINSEIKLFWQINLLTIKRNSTPK